MEKLKRQFKKVNIKGKEYIEVKERILALVENESPYSIETEYQYFDVRKMWVVKAKLTMLQTGEVFTGLAQEVESDDYKSVNSTSALENAETSAVGRACAFAGIGVIDSIASADEVNKAINRGSNFTNGVKKKELVEFIEEIRNEDDENHIKTLVNEAGAIYKTEKQLEWIKKEARERTDKLRVGN